MSKLRSDELVNMEGDGAPSFPQSATTIEPTADNQVATKSYVDLALSAASGNAVSATPPTNPALGSFWTDTSVSPSILKTWNGNVWIEFAGEGTPYTGFLGSPVEVLTPLDGAGVGGPTNYTAKTSEVLSKEVSFKHGKIAYNDPDLSIPASNAGSGLFAKGNGVVVWATGNYGVRTSLDGGLTWQQPAFPSTSITSLIWTGQKFLIGLQYSPFVVYSNDGINWTSATFAGGYTSISITGFAYSPTYDRVVASSTSNLHPIYYSDDHGVNWTHVNPPNSNQKSMTGVAWGNGKFIATNNTYDNVSIMSTNGGTTWTSGGKANNARLTNLFFNPDNNTFYAISAQNILSTTSGTSWNNVTTIPTGSGGTVETNGQGRHFVYDNGVYYVQVQDGSGRMIYSTDLTNWSRMWMNGDSSARGQGMSMIDGNLWFYVAYAGSSSNSGLGLWSNNRHQGFGTPVYNTVYTGVENKFTFQNSNVYNADTGEIVTGVDFATAFSGALNNPRSQIQFTPSSVSAGEMVVNWDSALDVYASVDQGTGDTLSTNSQLTKYGPSPSDVEFTSQNANTAPVSATDATVAFRKWTLETRASSSDPWTVVITSDDYDIAASQDGATPWSASPTLQPNTSYRVKVSYHSANAETIESNYNTFETGPS